MALDVCFRLTRSVLRVIQNRNGAMRALASHPPCLPRYAGVRTQLWTRSFCAAKQPGGSVTYDQVKKLLVSGSVVVIDVREPWELREYGSIPGSINVPLGQVSVALQLKPEEFKEKYGGDMPLAGECLIFTCLAGVRSQKALEEAQSLGYSEAQHYSGGWQDWAKHEILQTKV